MFRRKADTPTAAALFIASLTIASWFVPHFVKSGGKPWFYQEEFGPAVMWRAAGYVNPDAVACRT